MSALRELLARFAIKIDGAEKLQKTDTMVSKVTSSLKELAPVIGATALVAGFNHFTDEVDKLAKQARALDMPIESLQAWRRAANRAGLETTVLETGLSKIQKKAFDAEASGGALSKAFDKLGVSVKGTDGQFKSGAQLFQEVGEGLAGLDNQTEKTALAMLLFEEQGAKFLNLFGQSPEAIRATLAEMGELGAISEEQAAAVEEMNDAWGDVRLAFVGIVAAISGMLVPALTWLAERIESAQVWFRQLAENTNLLQSAAVVFATVITSKMLVALARWIAMNRAVLVSQLRALAPLALAVLLVDELITTWQGGDSLIRRAIDGIFGEGTTAKIVEFTKGAIENTGKWFDDFEGQWELFKSDIEYIWDELSDSLSDWSDKVGDDFEYLWDKLSDYLSGWADDVGDDFDYLITDIKAWFSGLWDSIISGAQDALAYVTNLIAKIPGAETVLGIESASSPAPSRGSQTNNVSQRNNVNITVQGGATGAETARQVGRAVTGALSPDLRPALNSLAPGF